MALHAKVKAQISVSSRRDMALHVKTESSYRVSVSRRHVTACLLRMSKEAALWHCTFQRKALSNCLGLTAACLQNCPCCHRFSSRQPRQRWPFSSSSRKYVFRLWIISSVIEVLVPHNYEFYLSLVLKYLHEVGLFRMFLFTSGTRSLTPCEGVSMLDDTDFLCFWHSLLYFWFSAFLLCSMSKRTIVGRSC